MEWRSLVQVNKMTNFVVMYGINVYSVNLSGRRAFRSRPDMWIDRPEVSAACVSARAPDRVSGYNAAMNHISSQI